MDVLTAPGARRPAPESGAGAKAAGDAAGAVAAAVGFDETFGGITASLSGAPVADAAAPAATPGASLRAPSARSSIAAPAAALAPATRGAGYGDADAVEAAAVADVAPDAQPWAGAPQPAAPSRQGAASAIVNKGATEAATGRPASQDVASGTSGATLRAQPTPAPRAAPAAAASVVREVRAAGPADEAVESSASAEQGAVAVAPHHDAPAGGRSGTLEASAGEPERTPLERQPEASGVGASAQGASPQDASRRDAPTADAESQPESDGDAGGATAPPASAGPYGGAPSAARARPNSGVVAAQTGEAMVGPTSPKAAGADAPAHASAAEIAGPAPEPGRSAPEAASSAPPGVADIRESAAAVGAEATARAADPALAPALAMDAPRVGAAPPPDLSAPAAAQTGLVAARDVAQAVAQSGDANRVELRLDPPELGRVQIDIMLDDGAVAASISAERPETLELLRRHADALQRELNAAGFSGANVAFSDRRPGGQPQAAQGQAVALDALAPVAATPAAHGYARPRPGSLDRLDIRL